MTDIPPITVDDYEEETHYCAVHPDKETELRCNKCGRYMCAQCAVATPIGYRCRQCVRQVEDRFFNVAEYDYPLAFGVAAGLSMIGGAIFSYVQFLLAAIFIGIFAGGAIAQAIMRTVQRRRGRYMAEFATAGVIVGGLLGGAIVAFLRYPDEFRIAREEWAATGRPFPPGFDEIVPSLSSYVFNNTLSLGMIAFIGITAFVIYSRMKS